MRCSLCGRMFKGQKAFDQHADAKHAARRSEAKAINTTADDSESIADMMIEAQLRRAMGEPVDDWLADMLPDEDAFR